MAETFRQEFVHCGKAACRSCPHGPYWYAYWRENGKVHKRYIGKFRPPPEPPPEPPAPPPWWAGIFSSATATADLAWRILEMQPTRDWAVVTRQGRKLVRERHPDRGGDDRWCAATLAALAYVLPGV